MTAEPFMDWDFNLVPTPAGFSGIGTASDNPSDYCRTLHVDDEAVAICGVMQKHPGVGEAWIWVSQDVLAANAFDFARTVKRELMPIADAKFPRIQATVEVGDERSIRFIEWLGFEREFETPLRNYGLNGEGDHWLYVRFNHAAH